MAVAMSTNLLKCLRVQHFFGLLLIVDNYVRVNRCMFSGDSNIDSYASGKEIVSVKMPSVSSVEGCQDENSSEPDVHRTDRVPKDSSGLPTFKQQIPDLVTLSLLPKSQWQSLINLDIIKVSLLSFMHLCFSLFNLFMQ